MTADAFTSRLLIAFSKGFGFRKLFESKLSKLLIDFEPDEVHLFQDASQIGKEFFEKRGVQVRIAKIGNTRNAVKRFVEDFSHIVVFWDGDDLTDIVFFASFLRKNFRLIPVQITKIRNKDKDERFDVYIGRGTPWGNPFPIGVGGAGDDRETVIEKFRTFFSEEILSNPEKHKALLSLRGYKLGCHCKPLACHGDIIAAYLNSYEGDE